MGQVPRIIRVHVKLTGLPDSVATAVMLARTPAETLVKLTEMAKKNGLDATYLLATEEEYVTWRRAMAESARAPKKGVTVLDRG